MIDACKVGLCEFYNVGDGPLGFMLGLIVGGFVIALLQRWRDRRPK